MRMESLSLAGAEVPLRCAGWSVGASISSMMVLLFLLMMYPSVFGDECAAEHAHPTREVVTSRLCRCELDDGFLSTWQETADAKVGENDLLRAAPAVFAVEDEPDWSARFHLD